MGDPSHHIHSLPQRCCHCQEWQHYRPADAFAQKRPSGNAGWPVDSVGIGFSIAPIQINFPHKFAQISHDSLHILAAETQVQNEVQRAAVVLGVHHFQQFRSGSGLHSLEFRESVQGQILRGLKPVKSLGKIVAKVAMARVVPRVGHPSNAVSTFPLPLTVANLNRYGDNLPFLSPQIAAAHALRASPKIP